MKIQKTILLLFLAFCFKAFGQKSDLFLEEDFQNSKMNISLHFCSEGGFYYFYKLIPDEITTREILSYGKFYLRNNKQYILIDKTRGFSTIIEKRDSIYRFVKSFEGCKDISLFEYNERFAGIFCDTNNANDFISSDSLNSLVELFSGDYLPENEFQIGLYFIYPDHKLILHKDGKYEFLINETKISKGNWKRKANLIILYDDYLKYGFKMYIANKNKLISILLPGDTKMWTYYRRTYNPLIDWNNAVKSLNRK